MKNEKMPRPKDLNREEKELLSSFEKGEWKTVSDIEKEKASARKIAAKTHLSPQQGI